MTCVLNFTETFCKSRKKRGKARQQITARAGYDANGYVRGMRFDVFETKGRWGRTPSGWVSLDWAKKI